MSESSSSFHGAANRASSSPKSFNNKNNNSNPHSNSRHLAFTVPAETGGDLEYNPKVVRILRKHVNAEMSTPDAAAGLARLLPEPGIPDGSSDELETLWDIFVEVAEKIPAGHVGHARLARLLVYLRQSPKTAWLRYDHLEGGRGAMAVRWTTELNQLLDLWSEHLIIAGYEPAGDLKSCTPDQAVAWVNTAAFFAHFHALSGGLLSSFCRRTMCCAFDGDHSLPATTTTTTTSTTATGHCYYYPAMDCHVSAAAQWILIAGQSVLCQVIAPPDGPDEEPAGPGHHPNHPNHLNHPNHARRPPPEHTKPVTKPVTDTDTDAALWDRWKAGFRAAAAEANLHPHTRQLARRAAALMAALDSNMMNPPLADVGPDVDGRHGQSRRLGS